MKRKILVTGATKGIGRGITERLLRDGREVIGIARNADPGFPATLYTADLADEADTARVLGEILAAHEIHGLVNNAGVSGIAPLSELAFADLRWMLEVNLRAAAQCAQAVAAPMVARGWGRIVNITSLAIIGRAATPAYSASKAGLDAMTRAWALEFAQAGITVNSIAPGVTATEMFNRNSPVGHPRRQAVQDFIPMHRFAEPAEIAAAVAYFLAEDAGYTTGQTLFVSGGWEINTP